VGLPADDGGHIGPFFLALFISSYGLLIGLMKMVRETGDITE
jgi:hypothetical protein